MNGKKYGFISFNEKLGETLKDRLLILIGSRSIRAAAKDWGMSVSTLNNYLKRGTEPALNVINHIAKIEHVSLDWIANGNQTTQPKFIEAEKKEELPLETQLKTKWLMILESIDSSDAESLIKAIHRKGIDGLLNKNAQNDISDVIDTLDIRFTLKQAIKEAMKGDEQLDKEILRRIEIKKNELTASQNSIDQHEEEHKKIG